MRSRDWSSDVFSSGLGKSRKAEVPFPRPDAAQGLVLLFQQQGEKAGKNDRRREGHRRRHYGGGRVGRSRHFRRGNDAYSGLHDAVLTDDFFVASQEVLVEVSLGRRFAIKL